MEGSTGETQDNTKKKSPFEDLTKDDLVKKCKNLLVIAQKAKQAKDETLDEVKKLQETISGFELQKNADKESLKAMQEIVERLTNDKLALANDVEEYRRKMIKMEKSSKNNKSSEDRTRIEFLETEGSIKDDEIRVLQERLKSLEREIGECQSKREESDVEKFEVEEKVVNLEEQIHEKTNIITELQEKLQNATTSDDESMERLKSENFVLNEKLIQLENDNAELKNLKESLQKELEEIKSSNNTLSSKLDDCLESRGVKTRQCEKLEEVTKDFERVKEEKETENETLKKENQQKDIKITQLKDEINECQKEINRLTMDLDEAMRRHKVAETEESRQINELNRELESLRQEKEDEITELKACLDNVSETLKIKTEEINTMQHSIEVLNKQKQDLGIEKLTENESHKRELTGMRETFEELLKEKESEIEKLSVVQIDDNTSVSHEKLQEEMVVVRNECEKTQQEFGKKLEEIEKLQEIIEVKEAELESFKLHAKDQKEVKVEYEKELRNARHETEKYQKELEEKLKEIKNLQETIDKQKVESESQIREKDSALEDVTKKVLSHKQENNELLDELKEINNILKERGEVISIQMSKISELESANTGLEVKLTEKETLQTATQAYEKQIKEMQDTIKNLESQKALLSQKRTKEETDMSVSQSDVLSTSTISKADEGARLREIDETYEDKYNKMRFLAVKLKKKVADQTATIAKLESEIASSVKKESDKDGNANEHLFLLSTLETKEQLLKQATEKVEQLQAELTKARAAIKKNSVLNLEMDSYEKSLAEISKKLDEKKLQIGELESTIKAQNEASNSFKDQIRELEKELHEEKAETEKLKNDLEQKTSKLSEVEKENGELKSLVDSLETEKEKSKLVFEESKLESMNLLGEKEKAINNLENEKTKALQSLSALQEKLDTLTESLQNRQVELDDLKTEYASYKVRAQSVLKQSQNKDEVKEKELEEELSALQTQYQGLEKRFSKLEQEKTELSKKVLFVETDKERLQARCDEFYNLVEEQRVANEALLEEKRQVLMESDEALKAKRLEVETVRLCYEKEIQQLLEKQQTEVDALKIQQEREALVARQDFVNDVSQAPDNSRPNMLPFGLASTDEQKINMILMQREEGEGSEHTSNYMPYRKHSTNRNKHDLIPLDELLSSPFDESYAMEERPVSPTIELHQTKEKLIVQETRVKHLSSLLAEAEQDLAKLTHLNEVLKEEVRRQQRSLEREQHTQNSEYLKNVIVKFLTLNSGNERVRLIPVLNTILKLSPEETQKLQAAAKGNEGLARLTGILPIWSNNN